VQRCVALFVIYVVVVFHAVVCSLYHMMLNVCFIFLHLLIVRSCGYILCCAFLPAIITAKREISGNAAPAFSIARGKGRPRNFS
jgi:hypothetical protein